jgi:hypothetical protein
MSFGSIPFLIEMFIRYSYISPTTLLIIMLLVGIVGAFIVSYFTKFGIYIISAISGIQFGFLLTEIIYPYSIALLVILAILFGLVGLILPYYFMNWMAIEITTFNGFLIFRSAIQYAVIRAQIGRRFDFSTINKAGSYWGILIGSLFVGCLGAIWQHYKYKNYPYLKNMDTNQTPDEKV